MPPSLNEILWKTIQSHPLSRLSNLVRMPFESLQDEWERLFPNIGVTADFVRSLEGRRALSGEVLLRLFAICEAFRYDELRNSYNFTQIYKALTKIQTEKAFLPDPESMSRTYSSYLSHKNALCILLRALFYAVRDGFLFVPLDGRFLFAMYERGSLFPYILSAQETEHYLKEVGALDGFRRETLEVGKEGSTITLFCAREGIEILYGPAGEALKDICMKIREEALHSLTYRDFLPPLITESEFLKEFEPRDSFLSLAFSLIPNAHFVEFFFASPNPKGPSSSPQLERSPSSLGRNNGYFDRNVDIKRFFESNISASATLDLNHENERGLSGLAFVRKESIYCRCGSESHKCGMVHCVGEKVALAIPINRGDRVEDYVGVIYVGSFDSKPFTSRDEYILRFLGLIFIESIRKSETLKKAGARETEIRGPRDREFDFLGAKELDEEIERMQKAGLSKEIDKYLLTFNIVRSAEKIKDFDYDDRREKIITALKKIKELTIRVFNLSNDHDFYRGERDEIDSFVEGFAEDELLERLQTIGRALSTYELKGVPNSRLDVYIIGIHAEQIVKRKYAGLICAELQRLRTTIRDPEHGPGILILTGDHGERWSRYIETL
jgi:hypothetical protein